MLGQKWHGMDSQNHWVFFSGCDVEWWGFFQRSPKSSCWQRLQIRLQKKLRSSVENHLVTKRRCQLQWLLHICTLLYFISGGHFSPLHRLCSSASQGLFFLFLLDVFISNLSAILSFKWKWHFEIYLKRDWIKLKQVKGQSVTGISGSPGLLLYFFGSFETRFYLWPELAWNFLCTTGSYLPQLLKSCSDKCVQPHPSSQFMKCYLQYWPSRGDIMVMQMLSSGQGSPTALGVRWPLQFPKM